MSFETRDLPDGWVVWNDEPEGRAILAYRPDVFDSQSFPAECMPTLFLARGSQPRRPNASRIAGDGWRVTLFLEPEVDVGTETFDARAQAVDGAIDYAHRFSAGEVDYRGAYQVPREDYFEKLDELTGRKR